MPMTTDGGRPIARIGTWNVEWAAPDGERGVRVAAALNEPGCDVVYVTEGCAEILPAGGHVIDGGPDWGCGREEGRRKVLVWSRQPWSAVDATGSGALPAGRFVAGITPTALGLLTVIGVCIPWRDAHVRWGRRDRRQWQEHEAWLAAFERLPYRHARKRTVVLGEFNQRIPRRSQPREIYEALLRAFEGFSFATAGELDGALGRTVDHIAHTPDLAPAGGIGLWPRNDRRDNRLSGRFGLWGEFALGAAGRRAAR